jgi:hypothetical protein
LRAPLTGLAFLAFEAGSSPLALRPGRSSRTALRLSSRLLSSIEPKLKFVKTFSKSQLAFNVGETTFKSAKLYLLIGRKFGENAVPELSLRFLFGENMLLDEGGDLFWDWLLRGGQNLMVYPDEQMRLAISRAVAVETPRGWRISKQSQSHKIDVVIALAMACHAAVRGKSEDFYDYTMRWIDGVGISLNPR